MHHVRMGRPFTSRFTGLLRTKRTSDREKKNWGNRIDEKRKLQGGGRGMGGLH